MKILTHELPEVFWSMRIIDDAKIVLSPKISEYAGILSYDDRGNANISITRKSNGECVFDMSLDNGEINIKEI